MSGIERQQRGTATTAGALIGERYVVEQRIGSGGTALVYRCRDQHTGQTVALKLLRSGNPLAPASRARFRREARLAANLGHPNIIRVLDYGETNPPAIEEWSAWMFDSEQPVDYLCMEYVGGPTLKQLVRRMGPCPPAWVTHIGIHIASGLASAHSAGIIHRDMKPQNVLLLDLATHVVPKLGDFGIARDLNSTTLSTLTQTGQVLGTPDYLAPEQVLGESGGVQSDLYALGIVLYELLTGHLPFEAESPLAAASRRMFVDPPPLRIFVPTLSRAMEDVILYALQREPANRVRTAPDFIAALEKAAARDQCEPSDVWPFGAEALQQMPGSAGDPRAQQQIGPTETALAGD
jgi:serine/threonine-protein kinase